MRGRTCKCLDCGHCKKHHVRRADGTYGACNLCKACEVFV